MRSVRIALAAGLALVAIAIGLTLLGAPMSLARTNKLPSQQEEPILTLRHGAVLCQAQEALPRGSTAIRVWLAASYGPHVSLLVRSGRRTITSGERASGWTGGTVTVPVKPLAHTVSGTEVCASFRLRDEILWAQGYKTPAAVAAREGRRGIGGRMWIDYLRPGTIPWAALIPSIVRRIGFGRAAAGSWVVFVALGLLVAAATLVANTLLRELR